MARTHANRSITSSMHMSECRLKKLAKSKNSQTHMSCDCKCAKPETAGTSGSLVVRLHLMKLAQLCTSPLDIFCISSYVAVEILRKAPRVIYTCDTAYHTYLRTYTTVCVCIYRSVHVYINIYIYIILYNIYIHIYIYVHTLIITLAIYDFIAILIIYIIIMNIYIYIHSHTHIYICTHTMQWSVHVSCPHVP